MSLPKALLIGDSIRMGYGPHTAELLKGVVDVHGVEENCGPTIRGLERLDAWLGEGRWDVIHFNFGLHDLKYVNEQGEAVRPDEGRRQVEPDQYEKNLDEIVTRLKRTGAKLIFATTTPVPEGTGIRVQGDAAEYNRIALRVMEKHGVQVNDLYGFAKPRLEELQNPRDVHFKPEGYRALAEQAAAAIRAALGLG